MTDLIASITFIIRAIKNRNARLAVERQIIYEANPRFRPDLLP